MPITCLICGRGLSCFAMALGTICGHCCRSYSKDLAAVGIEGDLDNAVEGQLGRALLERAWRGLTFRERVLVRLSWRRPLRRRLRQAVNELPSFPGSKSTLQDPRPTCPPNSRALEAGLHTRAAQGPMRSPTGQHIGE